MTFSKNRGLVVLTENALLKLAPLVLSHFGAKKIIKFPNKICPV